MEIKKTLAEKAVTLPIFAAFRFCFVNYAILKVLPSGDLRVGFCDGSHFIMTKNGDMFLMFLVCSVKHAPLLPSFWILAKINYLRKLIIFSQICMININFISNLAQSLIRFL
mgnify:CR=1 FL=1